MRERERTLRPKKIIPSLTCKKKWQPWNEKPSKIVSPNNPRIKKYINIYFKNYKPREVEKIKEHQASFCLFIKRKKKGTNTNKIMLS